MLKKDILEENISKALFEIAQDIQISEPFCTSLHTNYFISNLIDNEKQRGNLCWVILGQLGNMYDNDLKIRSTIDAGLGKGNILKENLFNALKNAWLITSDHLTTDQIKNERDPLILELIAHVILIIQRDNLALQFDNIKPEYVRPPHSKANQGGLDMIVLSKKDGKFIPFLGEIKAYKNDPKTGLIDACKKFQEINLGVHNTEIRSYFCSLQVPEEIKQQISLSFWSNQSNLSAFVGHNKTSIVENDFCSSSEYVKNVKCSRLLYISTPFENINQLFEFIVIKLENCINELG